MFIKKDALKFLVFFIYAINFITGRFNYEAECLFNDDNSTCDEETDPSNGAVSDGERGKCSDKVMNCKEFANPGTCCALKEMMNYSCEKTCRFCTEISGDLISTTPIPGFPSGNAPGPTGQTQQDPCAPSSGGSPSVKPPK